MNSVHLPHPPQRPELPIRDLDTKPGGAKREPGWRWGCGLGTFLAGVARLVGLSAPLLVLQPYVHGQARTPPHIGYVYPAGGQQGATVTISVGGQALAGASTVCFSGTGLHARVLGYDRPFTQKEINDLRELLQQLQDKRTASRAGPGSTGFTPEDEKALEETRTKLATRGTRPTSPALAETLTLEVTIASGSVAGARELRVKTPAGLSNPVIFCVGPLAEITDPVVTATANPPRPNAATAARAGSPRKVETMVALPVLINGQILPGEVDRFRFAAHKGQHITIMTAARALLPYLADAVPGWFQPTVALYDSTGRELAYADDFRFHPDPSLGCKIPADGEYVLEIKDAIFRGREDFVYRMAVGELPFVTSIFPLGGRAGETLRVESTGWNLPRSELIIDTLGAGRGVFEIAVRAGTTLSNPVRFATDERAGVVEVEPNDTTDQAQCVSLPVTIDGRIAAPGDVDVFSFEVPVAGMIVADLLARRLNSPLDSTVEILDHSGRQIATNDDFEDKASGLLTHHADSRIQAILPAGGTYFVRVTDTQRQGGPEYGYRLRLGPPEPDFALRIVPSTINVRAGGTVTLTAYTFRRDGFDGDITLGLKDAPKGFSLGGGRIPSGQESVRLTLTAPVTPSVEPQNLTVVGFAAIAGKRVGHVAVPAEDMMQAFAYRHLVPAQELKVQLTGRAAGLHVISQLPIALVPGGFSRIMISTPPARSVGEVKFELVEPPPGVAIVRCESAKDHINVVLSCDATKVKPGDRGNLILQAFGERAGTAKDKTAPRVQRSSLGTVPAVPFDIAGRPEPFPSG